jgi:hypothetical protein
MKTSVFVLTLILTFLAGVAATLFTPAFDKPVPAKDESVQIGTMSNGLPVYVRLVDGHQVEVTFEQHAMACPPPHDTNPLCVYVPAMIELNGFGANGLLP